ncbi:hypothetical protein TNCV_4112641 [Trichonephila clavipes]|nr:hypothetical protein TNCV_4112641 [Trichonephila clavipes]
MKYLGLIISKEGIKNDNSKVKAIAGTKHPKNSKEVSKFLGMAGWNPVGNLDGSQISCAALRALALNSREQLIREQREDPELGHIYRYVENPDDGSVNATYARRSSVEDGRYLITSSDVTNQSPGLLSSMRYWFYRIDRPHGKGH